ncbi:F-box domain-containing protein [Mycena sanguinolenta]|uniref:F-box domain-containing protein n=1 Tax=Mycena sanguinolenta TaxID=230812 RepID=A0A8H7D0J6_9AGAR|nr:F-box domain-containing protein [Mycena sanguinolenta]
MATMTVTGASVRAALLEQTEKTRQCSKAEIECIIEESEREIISLQSQIDALVESRDSHRARVCALKYIVSPIHSLPVELLAEIFDLAIEDETHIQDTHRISHVCSDWRRVAHSTSQLWTRPLQAKLWKTGSAMDGLKAWLACSEPMGVHISLISALKDVERGMFEEVLRVAHRLVSLEFPVTHGTPSWLVRELAQSQLDSLEELQLRVANWIDPAMTFTTVPRLRKLSLIRFPRVPQILVPWAQITDLTLSENTHDVTFGILALCPNLVVASITTYGWSDRPEIQPHTLVVSQLRFLTLHSKAEYKYITPFFTRLSTPLLQSIRVDFRDGKCPYWTPTDFTVFQLRAPNITRLEFANSDYFSLEAALRSSPSLTHLTLTSCTGSAASADAFISALHYEDGVPPLVPWLHTLIVRTQTSYFTEDTLARMVVSRWWTDAELASLGALPAVARWTYVELEFGFRSQRHYFGPRFTEIVKNIPADILKYYCNLQN